MLRRLLFAFVAMMTLAAADRAEAGGYTIYHFNGFNSGDSRHWYRNGLDGEVYTSAQSCINNIVKAVNWNKSTRHDFESFLIIYTDRYPSTDPNTELGTLDQVAGGQFGNWAGWYVYYVPSPQKGYYLNPYWNFHRYGR